MLYEFKSKAGGNVVMTQPVAERILAIIGKPPAAAGVFEPQHLPGAIAALQAEIAREAANGQANAGSNQEEEDTREEGAKRISLKQRAWPLLELMKAALAADQRITWGV